MGWDKKTFNSFESFDPNELRDPNDCSPKKVVTLPQPSTGGLTMTKVAEAYGAAASEDA
jgi:hypothetical protein